jgi:hypothetical protein
MEGPFSLSPLILSPLFEFANSIRKDGEPTTARIWLWRYEDLIAEAQNRLTRNLTPDEWSQYIGDEPYRKTFPDLP